jgi:hypothetical protein
VLGVRCRREREIARCLPLGRKLQLGQWVCPHTHWPRIIFLQKFCWKMKRI